MRRETKERLPRRARSRAQIGKRAQVYDLVRLNIERTTSAPSSRISAAGDQQDAHVRGVSEDLRPIENFIVQSNGERAETESRARSSNWCAE